jgi:thiosulfate/3-mercaptopyruvate sulfurtransferase
MNTLGANENSKIVVIGRSVSDFDRADAIRIAWTILVSGVRNVAVLDGGFAKWLREKKITTVDPTNSSAGEYRGKINADAIASRKHVLGKIGESVILDARIPEVYFGIETEPWALKPGHIERAVNLPAPWVFAKDGLLKSRDQLEQIAASVLGADKSKECIVYCGVGSYATVWSFLLTELLGYRNVKVYDGSMQDWIMDPSSPIRLFGWR